MVLSVVDAVQSSTEVASSVDAETILSLWYLLHDQFSSGIPVDPAAIQILKRSGLPCSEEWCSTSRGTKKSHKKPFLESKSNNEVSGVHLTHQDLATRVNTPVQSNKIFNSPKESYSRRRSPMLERKFVSSPNTCGKKLSLHSPKENNQTDYASPVSDVFSNEADAGIDLNLKQHYPFHSQLVEYAKENVTSDFRNPADPATVKSSSLGGISPTRTLSSYSINSHHTDPVTYPIDIPSVSSTCSNNTAYISPQKTKNDDKKETLDWLVWKSRAAIEKLCKELLESGERNPGNRAADILRLALNLSDDEKLASNVSDADDVAGETVGVIPLEETLTSVTSPDSPITTRVGGPHFSAPIMLAHPDEFKNPSSFLKIYGDPLCGSSKLPVKGKFGNWACKKCGNLNYPRRFRCNKCKKSRDETGDKIVAEYAKFVYLQHCLTYKKLGHTAWKEEKSLRASNLLYIPIVDEGRTHSTPFQK